MAYSVNKAIILGNVGRDPEVRHTQSGKAVANFSVATSSGRGDQERTEWHSVVAWDKAAELVGRFVRKGSKVYVEGRIQTREYTDRDGNQRRATEIVAWEIVFLDGKQAPVDGRQQYAQAKRGGNQYGSGGTPYADDEEIPF